MCVKMCLHCLINITYFWMNEFITKNIKIKCCKLNDSHLFCSFRNSTRSWHVSNQHWVGKKRWNKSFFFSRQINRIANRSVVGSVFNQINFNYSFIDLLTPSSFSKSTWYKIKFPINNLYQNVYWSDLVPFCWSSSLVL